MHRRSDRVALRTRNHSRILAAASDWRIHRQVQSIKPDMWECRIPTPQGAKLAFDNPIPFDATLPYSADFPGQDDIFVTSVYTQLGMVPHHSANFSFMVKSSCPIPTRRLIGELFEETIGTNGKPERSFSEVVCQKIVPAHIFPAALALIMNAIVNHMTTQDNDSVWDSIGEAFHLMCVGLVHDNSQWVSDKLRAAVSREMGANLPTGWPSDYDNVRDILATMAYWDLRGKKERGTMGHITLPPVWLPNTQKCRHAENQYCRVLHTNLLRICQYNNGKTLTRNREILPAHIGESRFRALMELMLEVGEDTFNSEFGGNPERYWDRLLLRIPGTRNVYDPLTNLPALVDLHHGRYQALKGRQLAVEGRALAEARTYTGDPAVVDPYWNPTYYANQGWRFS